MIDFPRPIYDDPDPGEDHLDAMVYAVAAWYERLFGFERAKTALIAKLRNLPLEPAHDWRYCRGLARFVPLRVLGPPPWQTITAPWGWTWRKVEGRNAVYIMPLWLHWIRRGYELLRWGWYTPLMRAGLLQGPDCGYYHEFRWSWRVWESRYNQHGYRARWFSLWKRLHDDWVERMPRWE